MVAYTKMLSKNQTAVKLPAGGRFGAPPCSPRLFSLAAWRRPCSQNLNHLGLDEIFKLSYSFLCAVTELRGKRVDLDEIQLLDILAQRSHLIARKCIAILLGYPAFIQQSEISAVYVVEEDLKIREWLDRNLFSQVRDCARRKMHLYLDLRWHYLYNSSF